MRAVIYLQSSAPLGPLFGKIMSRLFPEGVELDEKDNGIYRLSLEKGIEDLSKFLASYKALAEDAPGGLRAIVSPSEKLDLSPLLGEVGDGDIAYLYELEDNPLVEEMVGNSLAGFDMEILQSVKIYLEAGRSPALAGLRLYVHRNTVVYRISQFIRKTGYDLSRFDTGILLLSIIKKLDKKKEDY
ncbi:MAG: helix-turn-helix domain-containing protein [Bacillota bacterium]|nr:helix-turn-helix domain-containing protein [Bacillota bacterium]